MFINIIIVYFIIMKAISKFTLYGFIVGVLYALFAIGLHLFCYYGLRSQSCGMFRVPLIISWHFLLRYTPLFFGAGNLTFLYEALSSIIGFTIIGLIIGIIVNIIRKKN